MKNIINRFRVIGFIEGISYLVLLFLAMPLKYIWGYPMAVKVVGMTHGILFIAYVILLYLAHTRYQWGIKYSTILFIASLIPFGTFFTDKRLKEIEKSQKVQEIA